MVFFFTNQSVDTKLVFAIIIFKQLFRWQWYAIHVITFPHHLWDVIALDDDVGPIAPTRLHLHHRGYKGHHHGNWDVQTLPVVGQGQGMVTGTGRDHSDLLLVLWVRILVKIPIKRLQPYHLFLLLLHH